MMFRIIKPAFNSFLRLTTVGILLFAVTAIAFASKGSGDKKKHQEFENNFTPINASASFTLKTAPFFSGSMVSFHPVANNHVSLNAMITYQRGNTTFILPYKYKVNIGSISSNGGQSNLQFLGVRIQMPK